MDFDFDFVGFDFGVAGRWKWEELRGRRKFGFGVSEVDSGVDFGTGLWNDERWLLGVVGEGVDFRKAERCHGDWSRGLSEV